MTTTLRTTLLSTAALLAATGAWAQSSPAPPPEDATVVDEIVVKGQALNRRPTAYSTTDLGTEFIQERRVTDVEDLFRDVPGMTVRDIGYGAVASNTVIRGFGSGGHGGDLGVVVDGIPLNEANSHADGYVDVSVLVPLEIDSLIVYRGPVSALYGNFNRGGLVAFETRKRGDYQELDLSAGEYGTYDAQAAIGGSVGQRHSFNAAAQVFHTDSFRAQSTTDRQTFAGRYNLELTDSLDLALSTRLHHAEADGAARVTRAQFDVDPFGIDPRTQNDGADKDFGTFRGDLNYTINPNLRLLTFTYTTQQTFTRYFTRPVTATSFLQREETYDRDVYGLGANLNGLAAIAGRPVTYVVGVEGFNESTEFQFFDGLQRRVRVNPALNDRVSKIGSASLFAEANVPLNDVLELSLGVRYDRFTGECRILGPEAGRDPCDDLDDLSNLSPKLGLRWQALPPLQLRASFSEGFALPGGFTKYAPGAQSLEPNRLEQVELGARFTPTDSLEFDVVGYRIESSEEFRTISPGVFENFGATDRTGVEATASWEPTPAIELRAVYGYADSEITDNFNRALVGNAVTGVPEHTGTLYAAWRPTEPLRLNATYRHVGEVWLDAANTRTAVSYETLDVGASYELATRTPVRLYLNVENVSDERYATVTSLSFGQELLTPGAPRIVRAGVQVGF